MSILQEKPHETMSKEELREVFKVHFDISHRHETEMDLEMASIYLGAIDQYNAFDCGKVITFLQGAMSIIEDTETDVMADIFVGRSGSPKLDIRFRDNKFSVGVDEEEWEAFCEEKVEYMGGEVPRYKALMDMAEDTRADECRFMQMDGFYGMQLHLWWD